MKRKLSKIKTGTLERGLSVAGLTIKAGAHAIFGSKEKALSAQLKLIASHFGELKGSLMKVGQMLSVFGEHFLPPEANQILKTLHFQSPPLEWSAIQKHLNKQLGKELVAELEISEEPIAAASLGQVHKAKVKSTGEMLALKIQYPGIEEATAGDIRTLKRLLVIAKILPSLPDTHEIFAEIQKMLLQELDYKKEAENLLLFKNFFVDRRFVIPPYYARYSSKRVIAMGLEVGSQVDSKEVQALSQTRRNALGVATLDFYFQELFTLHRVQTDPHFGNYRIRIGRDSDQIVCYDFGAVREIDQIFLRKYKAWIKALFYSDRTNFESISEEFGILNQESTQALREDFWQLCYMVTEPFLPEQQPYDWARSDLLKRVAELTKKVALSHKLPAPPREMIFIDRKMAGLFTWQSSLGVKENVRPILEKYLS